MLACFVGGHVMLNDDGYVTRNGMRTSTRDTSTKHRTRRKDVGNNPGDVGAPNAGQLSLKTRFGTFFT